jgi:hypothetical protein
MFKIIGVDAREYGPVTADQIRAWIKEGRCNAMTLAQAVGGAGWRPLPEFPEFAASFAAPAGPPPGLPAALPPPPPQPSVGPSVEALLARDYDLAIGDCLGQGWRLLTANFWPAVGITFLALLLNGVPIVNWVVTAGLYRYFIRLRRGENASMEDLFAGFSDRFLPLFLAGLVSTALVGVAMFCCVPGIYLAVAWIFALPLVLERRMDFWEAMELSRKMVSKHWFTMLFLTIMAGICQLLGVLACIIGVYITAAWGMAAYACAYYTIFEDGTTPPGGLIPSRTLAPVGPSGPVTPAKPMAPVAPSPLSPAPVSPSGLSPSGPPAAPVFSQEPAQAIAPAAPPADSAPAGPPSRPTDSPPA